MGSIGRKQRITAGLLSGLLFATVFVAPASFAVSTTSGRESITLSPASKRIQLKPGEVRQLELTIVNDGEKDYTFTVYARPYSVKGENYDADFTNDAPSATVYQWVQFSQTSFRLKAGASVKVPYTIRVPANATPGGHYGVIFAETQPQTNVDATSIARKKRVGSIMYVTVAGTFKMAGSAYAPTAAFFQLRPPLRANHRITNSGNADFVATSTMRMYDIFGTKKAETIGEYVILPETTRNIPLSWKDAPWFGFYKVDISTKYLDKSSAKTEYVLLAPLWTYLVVTMVVGARVIYALSQRKKLR